MLPRGVRHSPIIMAAMRRFSVLAAIWAWSAFAAVNCGCDPAKPETLEARQCSLCREAKKHPLETKVFLLKDNNPRKPNRWLALPRAHGTTNHPIHDMSPEARTQLWTAAIGKAKELWGDDWGVAYNGDTVRTQCHAHLHIGKLLRGIENTKIHRGEQTVSDPGPTLRRHLGTRARREDTRASRRTDDGDRAVKVTVSCSY